MKIYINILQSDIIIVINILESLYEGIKMRVAGGRLGDVGSTIQRYCEERGNNANARRLDCQNKRRH